MPEQFHFGCSLRTGKTDNQVHMELGTYTVPIVLIVYGVLRDFGIPIIGDFKVNTGAGDLKRLCPKGCEVNGCI